MPIPMLILLKCKVFIRSELIVCNNWL